MNKFKIEKQITVSDKMNEDEYLTHAAIAAARHIVNGEIKGYTSTLFDVDGKKREWKIRPLILSCSGTIQNKIIRKNENRYKNEHQKTMLLARIRNEVTIQVQKSVQILHKGKFHFDVIGDVLREC